MNEAKDSPARRQQNTTIMVLGFALLSNAFINAGLLSNIVFEEASFPGGEYIFKEYHNDYAASWGVALNIADDLEIGKNKWDDLLYAVFVDNNSEKIPEGKERFFAGILIDKGKKELKNKLLAKNDEVCEIVVGNEKNPRDQFDEKDYQVGSLPSVDATVVHFPFTDGLFSALVQNMKVLPTLTKFAKERNNGKSIVISSTCSPKQQMCTYFLPHARTEEFFQGRPDTATYEKSFPPKKTLIQKLKNIFGL